MSSSTYTQYTAHISMEAAAHAIIRLVADMPGEMGRVRAARIVSKRAVSPTNEVFARRCLAYGMDLPWPLRDTIGLVDALIDGGLMTQTCGARPLLVLTRAGHHALDALEATGAVGLPPLV